MDRCLTDTNQSMFNQYLKNVTKINRYLTDTDNQFYNVPVYNRLSIGLHWLYRLNIGLLRFLP